MSRANSLMEWIDQTKKFSKSVDYLALDIIDSIMKVRHLVDRKLLFRNRSFFKFHCERYHKPSPLEHLKSRTADPLITGYVSESIKRAEGMQKAVEVQWFEIIDFIYERPELVDPRIMSDDYVRNHIATVCANNKKKNPLVNGMSARIGKYWKDASGRWRPERRKRF